MDYKKTKKAVKVADKTAVTVSGVFRVILKVLLTLLLIFVTTGLLFTCIFAYYVKTNLSDNLDVALDEMTLNLASTIYYTNENGEDVPIASLHGRENRVWVDYDNIPIHMEHAAVAIEDRRFYDHKGVDWYRTSAAFVNMFLSMKDNFGGSTITQQLIKTLTGEDEVTVQRKLLEIFRALQFERKYTEEEIIEWYLNVVPFGGNCYGLGAAADYYFGKDIGDLTLAECASIIGITNNPSLYNPYINKESNKERQELILTNMYEQGYIDKAELDAAIQAVIGARK